MDIVVYGVLFWVFAIVFTMLRSTGRSGSLPATLTKATPALLAAIFAYLTGPSHLFHVLLMVALILCALGDIGMEYNIQVGLVVFLLAHMCYVGAFGVQSTILGVTSLPIIGFLVCLVALFSYVVLYHRYLQTSETQTPLIRAVDLYAITLSLTASTSLLLWLSWGTFLGFLPFLGALMFITSDSLIGIKEFHHRFDYEEPLILGTYYLAIFLLSLSAAVYTF
ncbi:lysoplasmalogenase [Candidatus Thorarchaeota archaeon]|nr:MAG: lysoplasmalogenase [Candidatus Thorarchaeota archaeon]